MRVLDERVEIDAPADLVWGLLADFGGVSKWAPGMRASIILGDRHQGVGAMRAMRHAWGFQFQERITQWHEGKGFSFDVIRAPFPMAEVKETWVMAPRDGVAVVETQVRYGMRLGPLGRLIDWAVVRFIVRREMRGGLGGLKSYAERAAATLDPARYPD